MIVAEGEIGGGSGAVELLGWALRQARGVVDNVLTHASVSLSLTPRLEKLSLRKTLEEVAFDCGAGAEAKGIEVVVLTVVPEDLVIDADARLLHSALYNCCRTP